MNRVTTAVADLGIGAVAGYLGTKAMEPVGMWFYERESDADRAREDAPAPARPTGSPPRRPPRCSA